MLRKCALMSIQRTFLIFLVGVEGFEPPTSCSQSRRATRLRYTPISWSKQPTFYLKAVGILALTAFKINYVFALDF